MKLGKKILKELYNQGTVCYITDGDVSHANSLVDTLDKEDSLQLRNFTVVNTSGLQRGKSIDLANSIRNRLKTRADLVYSVDEAIELAEVQSIDLIVIYLKSLSDANNVLFKVHRYLQPRCKVVVKGVDVTKLNDYIVSYDVNTPAVKGEFMTWTHVIKKKRLTNNIQRTKSEMF